MFYIINIHTFIKSVRAIWPLIMRYAGNWPLQAS